LKVPDLKVPEKVGDLGSYLKEQRESARLSLRQLATVAGVSNPYLSQIERGLRKPSAEVLGGIAKGLQISAEALFQRAGLLENAGGAEVEAAIQSDPRLTGRQKRVLLDIYATFRAENARADVSKAQADEADEQDRETAEHVPVHEHLGQHDQPAHLEQYDQPDPSGDDADATVVTLPTAKPAPRKRARKRAQG
jgi:transcriptional regulator with XRE-family HTH domain